MAIGKLVSYLRVSTAKQGRSGLGIEAQRAAVESFLNGGRWTLVAEHVEVESGKRTDRPALAKALADCRLHGARLVVAKLDRLARNAAFLLTLRDSGVDFVAADMPEATRLTVGILAVVAEAEREAISARTKAALGAAKRRGVSLGGHPERVSGEARRRGAEASAKTRSARAKQRATDLQPVIEEARQDGATSLRAIAARLNDQKLPAPRGGIWTAAAVQRAIARL